MAKFLQILLFLFLSFASINAWQKTENPKLLIVTVATSETDGFRRFKKTVQEFGHDLRVFGMGEEWRGGDMENEGGGHKIIILRDGLNKLKNDVDDDTLILFTDSYDVIVNADATTIMRRFLEEFAENGIVFGAEPFCWPDKTLANKYPQVTFGERFLNSGGFIGRLKDLQRLLNEHTSQVGDKDDDQLFYTRLYLDEALRHEYKMTLDSLSRIFQNLNGMKNHVQVEADDDTGELKIFNTLYNTHPVIIHGNGPSKIQLNSFGNYIANQFNLQTGCKSCEPLLDFPSSTPYLTLAIFVSRPIPYVEEFLASIQNLDYSREHIHLYLFNNQLHNEKDIQVFVDKFGGEFKKIKVVNMDVDLLDERKARTEAIDWSLQSKTDYFMSIDADAHLTNPQAIKQLIKRLNTYDLRILAPMIAQSGKLFSNFWGAVQATGYYERSEDYVELVQGNRRSYWNVPFINNVYLIEGKKLKELREAYWFNSDKSDVDLSFAAFCRHYQHFMYVDNQEEYGFLIETDFFSQISPQTIHREIYDYPHNKKLWEKRYIHPKYWEIIKPDTEVEMVCPDVYDFPLVSERFAAELIELMENYGQWSSGKNEDERLAGGYENVPTRDIHMKQVGLHGQLLSIIDDYVAPVQEKVFYGYYQRPINSDMIFVVRYKPDEQAFLRPHLDASTYSIDVALNKRGVDYEGGGVRYVRYNCTVAADQVGYSMLFPGRLTHLHEGLPTTKGTRYILVSFINP